MRTTQQMSITLPHEMYSAVRAKVESGEYATESEVLRDGLRALLARDAAVEKWLRTEVVEICKQMEADPSQAIPWEDVKTLLAEKHAKRLTDT